MRAILRFFKFVWIGWAILSGLLAVCVTVESSVAARSYALSAWRSAGKFVGELRGQETSSQMSSPAAEPLQPPVPPDLAQSAAAMSAELAALRQQVNLLNNQVAPLRDELTHLKDAAQAAKSPPSPPRDFCIVQPGQSVPLAANLGMMKLVGVAPGGDSCTIRLSTCTEDWHYKIGQEMDVFSGPPVPANLQAHVTALAILANGSVAFRIVEH